MRTTSIDAHGVRERAAIAREALQVAHERLELIRHHLPAQPSAESNIAASNAAIAAIAASDALCGRYLGQRSASESHSEAKALIATIRPDGKAWANTLGKVLDAKTSSSYGTFITARTAREVVAQAEKLVAAVDALRL